MENFKDFTPNVLVFYFTLLTWTKWISMSVIPKGICFLRVDKVYKPSMFKLHQDTCPQWIQAKPRTCLYLEGLTSPCLHAKCLGKTRFGPDGTCVSISSLSEFCPIVLSSFYRGLERRNSQFTTCQCGFPNLALFILHSKVPRCFHYFATFSDSL